MKSRTPTIEPSGLLDREAPHIPGFVTGSLVASVHRRAAEAALLRDRRLELEIGRGGRVSARMVDGTARTLVGVTRAAAD